MSYKYGDVAFRWTEKVKGDLTGLKYQLPGEELEPDALITVSDDNDLRVRFVACTQRPWCTDRDWHGGVRKLWWGPVLGARLLPVLEKTLLHLKELVHAQEMFEEYFRGLKLAAPTARTFHLRVFLFFDMIQEPLTPAEYADGCDFFRTSRCSPSRIYSAQI